MKIKICGLQKTTLLDYPGHVAATVFLGGCNFRCPFCHNSELLGGDAEALMTIDELLLFLKRRAGILEGVCVTGGEPTLDPEGLEALLREIRSFGLLIKLDTNGSRPDLLKHLHREHLLDYVAMDIKSGKSTYCTVAGNTFLNMDAIEESIRWLIDGNLPFEFRTTTVKGIHTLADFQEIGPWIAGCPHYYLQNYVESEHVLSPGSFTAFTKEELLAFAGAVKPYVSEVSLRGIDY